MKHNNNDNNNKYVDDSPLIGWPVQFDSTFIDMNIEHIHGTLTQEQVRWCHVLTVLHFADKTYFYFYFFLLFR